MASDFATQPFTFKIDLVFNFEMKDKVQSDARENGKFWKRLAQHLMKWPTSTQNMKVIDRFIDLLTRLSWAARNHSLFHFCVVKIIHFLVCFVFSFIKSLNYIRCVMLQNHWPHVVQTAMERRTCVIFNVFDRWRGHVINRILHSWSVNMKFMKLVV